MQIRERERGREGRFEKNKKIKIDKDIILINTA